MKLLRESKKVIFMKISSMSLFVREYKKIFGRKHPRELILRGIKTAISTQCNIIKILCIIIKICKIVENVWLSIKKG